MDKQAIEDSASSSSGKRRFQDITSLEQESEYAESAWETDGDDEELFVEPEDDQDPSSTTTGIIDNAENTAFQTCLENILRRIVNSMGREHYRLYRTGEEFDDATWKDFRARSRELRGAVLALADAIAQAVLVDKAARATECDLWPALAFFNLNAFVLIGEWLVGGNGAVQAAIIIKWTPSRTTRRVRGPAPDVTILSAPPEWSACHHAHGAAPNAERVAQMVSSVFYNGELQTSRATADQTRELVRQINLLNRRTLSRSGQMLFLVKDSIDHHDAQQLSRLAHRSVAAALVIRLPSQQVAEPTILVTP
ncbi:hypothetical protein CNMCM5623_009242 [Aspergillus felis]|uniref:Uncharacterized protein n=1 Tax=Aspergillus felis TaxID=1287682 RepID=A0A8H6UK82_9EURO|nr:hypothetical protein CNMCM5623_009242 [Aspergillus felis]